MLKVNEKAILDRINVLNNEIANNDRNAEQKAEQVCIQLGTPEDVALLKKFLLENKAEYNVADKEKELNYLMGYCDEVQEVEVMEQTESETAQPEIYG